MSTLACKNVAYAYEKGKGILTNISFSFESGKMYAILGPSGSGKTTLLSLLGGLDTPAKGNILFDDTDITQTGLEEHRRNHISLIFQNYNLIDYMTPIENTKLVSKVDTALRSAFVWNECSAVWHSNRCFQNPLDNKNQLFVVYSHCPYLPH